MTEQDFLVACDRVLLTIEDALDRCDCDVQTGRSGQVLELEFDDDSKIIVNGNTPVREIWVAARAGGFHFRWQDGLWRDSRSGDELFECLSRLVSQQSGAPVRLAAKAPPG
jgi:CyaY protein